MFRPKLLIDSSSATHVRSWENQTHNRLGLKRSHGNLIRFSVHDNDYTVVLEVLRRMTSAATSAVPRGIAIDERELFLHF